MKRDYYSTGKRGTLDGVPIWRPKWYGELGNDAEYLEAIRPRDTFKAAYYAGGYRMQKDSIPCRLAGYVADWAPWMRRALHRGDGTKADAALLQSQMEILWPAYGREQALRRAEGLATCLAGRHEYHARHENECWACSHAKQESERAAA